MPKTLKTEGIVLRGIRYGEADRILHLYTADCGRLNAIAKGVRRPSSRFGGRLEPFFRVELVLHRGRSDLATVTGAHTVEGHGRLRSDGAALNLAARAGDAVLRLLDSTEPNRPAYNLLSRYLDLLDRGGGDHPSAPAQAVAFRAKLALATGFAPELATCAECGEAGGLVAFSARAGGVVCGSCEGEALPLGPVAYGFLVSALTKPMAEIGPVDETAVRRADRALTATLEHHAHVSLKPAA